MEISARILSRSVYIPEETVQCEIILNYRGDQVKQNESGGISSWITPTNTDQSIEIAYASVQIYCQCIMSERKLRYPQPRIQRLVESAPEKTTFSPCAGF